MRLVGVLASIALVAACGLLPEQPYEDRPAPRGTQEDGGKKPQPKPAPNDEAWVRATMQRLMDEPRHVPAAGGYPAGTRGGPGSFGKLSSSEVDEIVASVIYAGDLFMPPSLPPQLRYALILVDISAESAFKMSTEMPNGSAFSTGLQQVTGAIWLPMWQQRAHVPGLRHYDGSPWDPQKTTFNDLSHSIWISTVVANWAMSEMAKAGGANPRSAEFREGGDGPMPRTVRTMYMTWNSGYPRARVQPPTDEYVHYEAMIVTDLHLLGLPESLLNTTF